MSCFGRSLSTIICGSSFGITFAVRVQGCTSSMSWPTARWHKLKATTMRGVSSIMPPPIRRQTIEIMFGQLKSRSSGTHSKLRTSSTEQRRHLSQGSCVQSGTGMSEHLSVEICMFSFFHLIQSLHKDVAVSHVRWIQSLQVFA